MSLPSRSMFASLTVKVWQASSMDRAIAMGVERDMEADNRTMKVVKSLAPSEHLLPLRRLANYGREEHKRLTLPGLKDGVQLLATRMFDDYAFTQQKIKDAFEQEVKRFVGKYPHIIEVAPERLGGAYRAEDFPSVEQISGYFDYSVTFAPVPETGNWLLDDVDYEDMARLRNQVENDNNKMYREASKELFERGLNVLDNLAKQAEQFKEGQPNGSLLREATINSVKEMSVLISAMNITADPVLEQIGEEMRSKFHDLDAKEMQHSQEKRTDIADFAKALIKKMSAAQ